MSAAGSGPAVEQQKAALLKQVQKDDINELLKERGFVYYAVTPMSNIKRTALTYPEDGKLEDSLYAVCAQGEYEPLSLVLYSGEDQ